jgi:hypothetical protein
MFAIDTPQSAVIFFFDLESQRYTGTLSCVNVSKYSLFTEIDLPDVPVNLRKERKANESNRELPLPAQAIDARVKLPVSARQKFVALLLQVGEQNASIW